MTLPKIGKPATRALNSQGIYTLEAVSQYTSHLELADALRSEANTNIPNKLYFSTNYILKRKFSHHYLLS